MGNAGAQSEIATYLLCGTHSMITGVRINRPSVSLNHKIQTKNDRCEVENNTERFDLFTAACSLQERAPHLGERDHRMCVPVEERKQSHIQQLCSIRVVAAAERRQEGFSRLLPPYSSEWWVAGFWDSFDIESRACIRTVSSLVAPVHVNRFHVSLRALLVAQEICYRREKQTPPRAAALVQRHPAK